MRPGEWTSYLICMFLLSHRISCLCNCMPLCVVRRLFIIIWSSHLLLCSVLARACNVHAVLHFDRGHLSNYSTVLVSRCVYAVRCGISTADRLFCVFQFACYRILQGTVRLLHYWTFSLHEKPCVVRRCFFFLFIINKVENMFEHTGNTEYHMHISRVWCRW